MNYEECIARGIERGIEKVAGGQQKAWRRVRALKRKGAKPKDIRSAEIKAYDKMDNTYLRNKDFESATFSHRKYRPQREGSIGSKIPGDNAKPNRITRQAVFSV